MESDFRIISMMWELYLYNYHNWEQWRKIIIFSERCERVCISSYEIDNMGRIVISWGITYVPSYCEVFINIGVKLSFTLSSYWRTVNSQLKPVLSRFCKWFKWMVSAVFMYEMCISFFVADLKIFVEKNHLSILK